ncbi:hypothetical protein [Streptomyces sp. NPDC127164]|uniref:hypothetical protein n=1 Tax=Streptomyces sp. NPDC127164 TaxID=3345379 RepID=UPI003640EB29
MGTGYSDHDLVAWLESAGVTDAEAVLDQPGWVEWREGQAHDFGAAGHPGQCT